MTDAPMFRVVKGEPTAEELAALTAVLAGVRAAHTRAAQAAEARGTRTSHWAGRAGPLRLPLAPGSGAWRRSALPR